MREYLILMSVTCPLPSPAIFAVTQDFICEQWQEPASRQDPEAENNDMVFKETKIKNIKEVTEPLKEEILKGDVHTIEEM